MAEASAVVLGGLQLRSDARLIRFPGRYQDERGLRMWATVCRVLGMNGPADGMPEADPCTGATSAVHACTPGQSYCLFPSSEAPDDDQIA
jgi:hypothetical protein